MRKSMYFYLIIILAFMFYYAIFLNGTLYWYSDTIFWRTAG